MVSKRPSTRLVVCVDGTWFNPDGLENASQGSLSNTFRIYSCVREGWIDSQNVHQKKRYWPGPGTESGKLVKTAAGILGLGCDEIIKEVYQYCCEEAVEEYDEIYFFGFSRGAYIVRAVAGLLHNMRAIRTESGNFDADYKQGLGLYSTLCAENATSDRGKGQHFLSAKTRKTAMVRFVGCFDTVKAVKVMPHVHDISVNIPTCCYRQALALNEERSVFKHEILQTNRSFAELSEMDGNTSKPRYLDAWFIGTHGDMGGGNKHDGLSLYPLQWILSEAKIQGLSLTTDDSPKEKNLASNITELLFPSGGEYVNVYTEQTAVEYIPYEKPPLRTNNGISIGMWDIRLSHRNPSYKLQINVSLFAAGPVSFNIAPRRVFDRNTLVGYQPDGTSGTIVHPSVYMLHDTCSFLYNSRQSWSFGDDLIAFRESMIPTENQQFWDAETDGMPTGINHIRILVCGNNGIGKSTLINKVFGIRRDDDNVAEVREGEHGQHDIEREIRHPAKRHLVIHDSRGFQARADGEQSHNGDTPRPGEVDIVRRFLADHLSCPDINDRLHVIWYCVDITRNRYVEEADRQLFEVVRLTNSAVPLVLVLTKKDAWWHRIRSERMAELEEASEEADEDVDYDKIRQEANYAATIAVEERATRFRQSFETLSYEFLGPVLTSKQKQDFGGYRRLVNVSKGQLHGAIHNMFVAAQHCNVDPKIVGSIQDAIWYAKIVTRTAAVPAAADASLVAKVTCGPLLAKAIMTRFGYDYYNADIAWRIFADCVWSDVPANAAYFGAWAALFGSVALFSPAMPVVLVLGTALPLANIPRTARMFLMCAADMILIMERAFWFHYNGGGIDESILTDEDIRQAALYYSDLVQKVHDDIAAKLPLTSLIKCLWNTELMASTLQTTIDRYRFKPRRDSQQ